MNKQITIDKLPYGQVVTGYLWLSDAQTPYAYYNEELKQREKEIDIKQINDQSNPFVVEGQLYCKDLNKSYSIKYLDGKHIVIEYNLRNVPEGWECTPKQYIPNRIKASKLKFKQYWKPEIDPLCGGMNVLVPAAFVFVGFNEKEN